MRVVIGSTRVLQYLRYVVVILSDRGGKGNREITESIFMVRSVFSPAFVFTMLLYENQIKGVDAIMFDKVN